MTDSASVVFVGDDDASIRESLKNLLRTAIEQAGAERGVLVLSRWTEPRIAAQATTGDGGIVVKLHDEAMTPAVLPESVIQYVVRTNESVILDDAAAQNPFSADPYIRQQHARSILCLPFLNQGQLIGVLYLENNLTPGVFAPARIAVLKLLASQAAISLENARLYRDLAEREAKIRRLVEAQTPQAEDELRAIINNAPVFLWSDLPDGYCDFLNQPWLTYFNLSLQEAQGAGWAMVLHPDDAAHHLESWQKSVSTGIPFETEARYRRSDGEYRWFLNRANPLRDKTGRIVKWYGTNIDIENLKRTEGRLRQSEAYLAEAQRLSHTGSFGWRPDSGEIVWSDETYCIFEYDRAVKPTIDLMVQRVHPEDRVDFHDVIDRASRGATHFEHAYRLLLPDRRVKHVHALAHALQDASGNCEFVGAVMDVTERKRAEEAVLRSEKELRNVIETIPISVWTALPDGTVDFVSRHWREHSDLSEQGASGAGWQTAVHPEDIDRHLEKWRASLATGAPFENEARRRAADGEYRWFLARAVPLRDEQGNILKWYGITMEIDDRKKAEEKLRRSEASLLDAQRLSRTGSWTHDVSSGKVTISPEIVRMWGIQAEDDAEGADFFFARMHPEDRHRVEQAYREAQLKKAEYESDFRIVLPDGTIRIIHSLARPVVSESGDIVEYIGAAIDITERERAEEERQAHLWFLESMDQVNRAIQGTNDLEQMMSDMLDAMLSIFNCDRAWLVYPCDPEAASWKVPMEHARPEFPGLFVLGLDLPVDPEIAKVFQTVRASSGPVRFGPGSEHPLPAEAAKRFSIQSMIGMAIYPKGDKPYMLGLHQCSYPRVWTPQEERLFQEIGRRLEDELTSLLMFRNLGESERKLEEAQRLTHVGYWERDPDTDLITWSDETYRIFGLEPQARILNLLNCRNWFTPKISRSLSKQWRRRFGVARATTWSIEWSGPTAKCVSSTARGM